MFPTDLILSKVMNLFISAEVETFSFKLEMHEYAVLCTCLRPPREQRSRFSLYKRT